MYRITNLVIIQGIKKKANTFFNLILSVQYLFFCFLNFFDFLIFVKIYKNEMVKITE